MNYFELFNIDPCYEIDEAELELKYLKLQQKYHPDNCKTVDDQLISIEKTIEINNAYSILSDDVSLVQYYLKNEGFNLNDEDIQKNLTPLDLMFLLDLQEMINENPSKINLFKQELKEKTSSIRLSLVLDIKNNNKENIASNLSKLIFFNKSLKHID